MKPTKIYIKEFKANKKDIKALAHITGGGLVENLPRVLPEGLGAVVQKSSIKTLPVFDFMSQYVEESEMYRTLIWVSVWYGLSQRRTRIRSPQT